LVDSIRDGSALGRLFGIAYIPRWLIRYRTTTSSEVMSRCLYSSLVDSIPNRVRVCLITFTFIFLIGWFDTKLDDVRERDAKDRFIFLIGWFDTAVQVEVYEVWRGVYIPHWLIRYTIRIWIKQGKLEGLYSSLVDSIPENRVWKCAFERVYIPHWLIRYSPTITILARGYCLYSSLVDSIPNRVRVCLITFTFIFLIGWFDTKLDDVRERDAKDRFIFLIGWFDTIVKFTFREFVQFIFLIGWFDTHYRNNLVTEIKSLYSSLVDSIRSPRSAGRSKVYIPHWLIRYRRFTIPACFISTFIFLIGWFDTFILSPRLLNRFSFIFLIGWFDTKFLNLKAAQDTICLYSSLVDSIQYQFLESGISSSVYIPHWLIRYRRLSWLRWVSGIRLYSSLVDSIPSKTKTRG